MKKSFIVAFFIPFFTFVSTSHAQVDFNCKKKEDNLKIQLRYAEQHGNIQRAENLKRALINVREHCGQSSYIEDPALQLDDELYKKTLNEKIIKQQAKVAAAEKELMQAKLSDKIKKIREKTEKLQERQIKLEAYQKELQTLP